MNQTDSIFKKLGLKGSDDDDDDSDDSTEHKRRALMDDDGKLKSHDMVNEPILDPIKSAELFNRINICDHNSGNKPHKRFSIWSDILLEEQITDGMNNAMSMSSNGDAFTGKYDRNCENYAFWNKKSLKRKAKRKRNAKTNTKNDTIQEIQESKDNHNDISHVNMNVNSDVQTQEYVSLTDNTTHERGTKRKRKNKSKKRNKCKKNDAAVHLILQKLNEPKAHLIKRTIDTIGHKKAIDLCFRALDVESAGGLMTADGSRRRTTGGVFFQMLRNDPNVTKENINYIFECEQKMSISKKKFKKQKYRLKKAYRSKGRASAVIDQMAKSIDTMLTIQSPKEPSLFSTNQDQQENSNEKITENTFASLV